MKLPSTLFAVIALSLFVEQRVLAQVELDAPFAFNIPPVLDILPNPQTFDLGDIASDGSAGRQNHVRPLEPDEVGHAWKFFPPHLQLPEVFPDPTPATPAQQSIFLTEGSPLVLVIPQLAHFPTGANVSVEHQLDGREIIVQASIHYLPFATATIYGPHEYLMLIGLLDPGEYHLTFNLSQTSDYSDQVTLMSGFMDFVVHPIPEPSSAVLCGLSAICLLSARRAGKAGHENRSNDIRA